MTPARTAAVLILSVAALTGCGNWIEDTEIVGSLAVGADAEGQPTVLVAPCRSGRPVVIVSGTRTPGMPDDEENTEHGEWVAARATAEVSELFLAKPGEGWSSEATFAAEPDKGYLVDGTFWDEDATVLVGLAFTVQNLARLEDDQVLVGDGGEGHETIARADFDADCSR